MKNNARSEREDYSKMKQLVKELMAELLGTYLLLMIGCCASASYALNINNDKNKKLDFMGVNYSWGFAAFIGISASMAISGGHINPAVSIAFATMKRFPWSKVAPYILAQLVGAFLGAATAYVVYFDAINTQHNLDPIKNNTELRAFGHSLSTGGIFATYPAAHITILGSFIDQVVATCSLLISVMAVVDKNNLNVPMNLQPFLLAFVIAAHAQAFGFNTSCSMNPARDFGPRLFTWAAGWGIAVFKPLGGHYWWSSAIMGPIIGATLGVWLYYYVIEFFYSEQKETPNVDNYPNELNSNELKPV